MNSRELAADVPLATQESDEDEFEVGHLPDTFCLHFSFILPLQFAELQTGVAPAVQPSTVALEGEHYTLALASLTVLDDLKRFGGFSIWWVFFEKLNVKSLQVVAQIQSVAALKILSQTLTKSSPCASKTIRSRS